MTQKRVAELSALGDLGNKRRGHAKLISGGIGQGDDTQRKIVVIDSVRRKSDGHGWIIGSSGPFDTALECRAGGNEPVIARTIEIDGSLEVIRPGLVRHERAQRSNELNLDAVFQIDPRIGLWRSAFGDGEAAAKIGRAHV